MTRLGEHSQERNPTRIATHPAPHTCFQTKSKEPQTMAAGPRHNNLSREVTRTCFCVRCFVCRPPETRPNTKTRGLLKDAAPSAHRQADQAPANTTYHIRQVANEPTPAPHRTKKRKQTKTKEGSKKKKGVISDAETLHQPIVPNNAVGLRVPQKPPSVCTCF